MSEIVYPSGTPILEPEARAARVAEITKLFHDTFLLVDEGIVKLVLASIVANRLNADPVWLFVVGPSGSGKTEFISSLDDIIDVHAISSLTSKTFISGKPASKEEETSLLLKIGQFGILTFKDFTTILSMNPDERAAIMGQLREIYDGSMIKVFGTGKRVEWYGKIGLIAGVTDKIHMARQMYAAMGERFIMYSFTVADRRSTAERAMQNTGSIAEQRKVLREEMRRFFDDQVQVPLRKPTVSQDIKDDLLDLAELATRARSPVERDYRSSTKEILQVYPPEMPTRFAMQLTTLACALQYLNGDTGLTPMDTTILYKIALDSIDHSRRLALRELARYDKVETAGLATKLNMSTPTVRRWLEDLNALGVIDRQKRGGAGNADVWMVKENYRNIIMRFEHLTAETGDLTENRASDIGEPPPPEAWETPDEKSVRLASLNQTDSSSDAVPLDVFDSN